MHILWQVFRSENHVVGAYVQAQSSREQEIRVPGVRQGIPLKLQTEGSL